MDRKNPKYVVCFDLFGTLLALSGPDENMWTYEGALAEFYPREKIQELVRSHLMINECHPLDRHDGQGKLYPDYEDQLRILLSYMPMTVEIAKKIIQWPEKEEFPARLDWLYIAKEILVRRAKDFWWRENAWLKWVEGAESVLQELWPISTLVLVTNVTPAGWWHVDRDKRIWDRFDQHFLSFRHNFAKPDIRVWWEVKSRCPDLPADQFWMIGDSQENDLAVPASMGWQTILVGKKGVPISEVPRIIEAKS